VVLAPYNAVLMPDARDSLGIELQDSVLVFDEAHNLLDALNSAHSTTVTGKTQAAAAPSMLLLGVFFSCHMLLAAGTCTNTWEYRKVQAQEVTPCPVVPCPAVLSCSLAAAVCPKEPHCLL
jgi:Rad3-related DNA helicase